MTNGVNTPRRNSKPSIAESSDIIDNYINTQKSISYKNEITFTPRKHPLNNIKIFSNNQYFMEIKVYNTTQHLLKYLPIAAKGSDEHKTLWEKLLATTSHAKSLIEDIHSSIKTTPNVAHTDINPLPESLPERLEDLETCLSNLTELSINYAENGN